MSRADRALKEFVRAWAETKYGVVSRIYLDDGDVILNLTRAVAPYGLRRIRLSASTVERLQAGVIGLS